MEPQRGTAHKHAILSLVERGGRVRSVHLDKLNSDRVGEIVRANVAWETWLMTNEARHYRKVGEEMAGLSRVHHTRGEYVDPEDATINTQTIEGYFSIFKQGMKGVYKHCREKHLHRYLAEFDFRYNNRIALGVDDKGRAAAALVRVKGKRLTYKQPQPHLA